MQEQPSKREESDPPVVDHIEELANRLRQAEHLDPEARAEAADLMGDLAAALDQPETSTQAEHLAQRTAQLVQAVKDQHEPGLIAAARERVEEAVARAESEAPVATDIVLQLIDVLVSLGI
jgi:selenophosphate synthetase-related protein